MSDQFSYNPQEATNPNRQVITDEELKRIMKKMNPLSWRNMAHALLLWC